MNFPKHFCIGITERKRAFVRFFKHHSSKYIILNLQLIWDGNTYEIKPFTKF